MKKDNIERYRERVVLYIGLISFLITFNLFFGMFVWNKFDLSPNIAIGFVTFLFIGWIILNWVKDRR